MISLKISIKVYSINFSFQIYHAHLKFSVIFFFILHLRFRTYFKKGEIEKYMAINPFLAFGSFLNCSLAHSYFKRAFLYDVPLIILRACIANTHTHIYVRAHINSFAYKNIYGAILMRNIIGI